VPLKVKKNDISLGNQEHSDMFFLKDSQKSLDDFLNEGGIKGIPAADHLLGDISLFRQAKYIHNLIK
jgi:hypothetical protein